jgi:hypothetical protein
MPYTFEQKLKAVERELSLRKQVYPGSVKVGRMKQADADYQIDVFEEIARDYERAIERRHGQQEQINWDSSSAQAADGSEA